MKWIVIATPSPFRDYLISAIPTPDILAVIYESGKEASAEYDTFVDFEANIYSKFIVEPNINIKYYRTLNVNTLFCLDLIKFLVDANPKEKIGILLTGANWIRRPKLEAILAFENINQILNIHFGDCLNYRGLDSNLWALYHRDSPSLGISIHLVENMLDTGDRVIFTSLPSPTSYTHLLESQIECTFLAISQLITISMSNDFDFPERVKNDGSGRYYGLMPSVLKKHIHQRFY